MTFRFRAAVDRVLQITNSCAGPLEDVSADFHWQVRSEVPTACPLKNVQLTLKAGSYSDIIPTNVFSDESVLRRMQVYKEASRRMPCRRVLDDEILELMN